MIFVEPEAEAVEGLALKGSGVITTEGSGLGTGVVCDLCSVFCSCSWASMLWVCGLGFDMLVSWGLYESSGLVGLGCGDLVRDLKIVVHRLLVGDTVL